MMEDTVFEGGFLMLLFWVLVIFGIVYLIMRLTRLNSGSTYKHQSYEDEAIRILRERLAKGEIDREEFEKRMQTLKQYKALRGYFYIIMVPRIRKPLGMIHP